MKNSDSKVDGNKVVDAAKPVEFRVTPRDVKIAARKDRFTCPLSWAITRWLGAKQASVTAGVTLIQFGATPVYRRYRTTRKARDALVRFDRTGEFEPDDFKLVPFAESHKLGSRFHPTGKGAPKERVKGVRFERPVYKGK
jgi:hypothetical protein